MNAIVLFFRRLFCSHTGGEMIRVNRGMNFGIDREVYGVFICEKCGATYIKDVNRNDPAVKAMLPPM